MALDPALQRPSHSLFTFEGRLEPSRLSWSYRLGLVVVTVAMLLLPLVYVGVIAFAGIGVWWHVTHNAWLLDGGPGVMLWRLLLYVAPALAGAIVTFFMVKPVLARSNAAFRPLVLEPSAEPVLFAFIEQICAQVGAPAPRQVQVDCQPNASAGLMPGLRSFLRRDLVLTIGLPLAASLTVRELGGVLAHEFGHFAQGGGLRLTALVRGVNGWFARVVYQRDNWDRRLQDWSEGVDWRLALLLVSARGGVWLSRLLLQQLMVAGHFISCFMVRQMEYDADSYEIKVAGSTAFVTTMGRLRALHGAIQQSEAYLQSELDSRRLPSDLSAFLVTWLQEVPSEQSLEVPSNSTGWFDTHPADGDRVRAAEAAGATGVLVGGGEAGAHLFAAFERLSARVTSHHYAAAGLPMDELALVDAADAVRGRVTRGDRQRALEAIFDLGLARCRALSLPPLEALEEVASEEPITRWRFPDVLGRYDQLVDQRDHGFVAGEMWHAGFTTFDPAAFGLTEWTRETATGAGVDAARAIAVLDGVLGPYERSCMRRIARGLSPAVAAESRGDEPADVCAMIAAFNAVSRARAAWLDDARRRVGALEYIGHFRAVSPRLDDTQRRLDDLSRAVRDAAARMREPLVGVVCPQLLGTHSTLEAACGMTAEAGFELGRASVQIETVYISLLLELCWLGVRGEMEAPRPRAAEAT